MKGLTLNTPRQAIVSLGGVLGIALLWLFISHWGEFVQYCLSVQITLHRYLVLYLLQLHNHQASGALMLAFGGFLYGFLHAIGPGHGKFVITTYLATHRESLKASRLITLAGSLMQGVTAILFVVVLAVLFNLSMGDLSLSRYWVEKGSALLIAGFGVVLVCRALGFSLRRREGHDHHEGCGHHHQPAPGALTGGWRNTLWVVAAIGFRPCSGAIMVLVFANALGIFSWGVAAVMAMALGTALSVMILATLVHHAREWAINASDGVTRYAAPAARVAAIIGGLLLMLFALVLFTTVIPAGVNGDFITAGC